MFVKSARYNSASDGTLSQASSVLFFIVFTFSSHLHSLSCIIRIPEWRKKKVPHWTINLFKSGREHVSFTNLETAFKISALALIVMLLRACHLTSQSLISLFETGIMPFECWNDSQLNHYVILRAIFLAFLYGARE